MEVWLKLSYIYIPDRIIQLQGQALNIPANWQGSRHVAMCSLSTPMCLHFMFPSTCPSCAGSTPVLILLSRLTYLFHKVWQNPAEKHTSPWEPWHRNTICHISEYRTCIHVYFTHIVEVSFVTFDLGIYKNRIFRDSITTSDNWLSFVIAT